MYNYAGSISVKYAFVRSDGLAVHISWSKCCLVCVWMLTIVAQIITAAPKVFLLSNFAALLSDRQHGVVMD